MVEWSQGWRSISKSKDEGVKARMEEWRQGWRSISRDGGVKVGMEE
jgi:hypothetical protein